MTDQGHPMTAPDIDEADLDITVGCKAAHPDGMGGQHVTKQCTAVRITHRPTGTSVVVGSERSQHGNRQKAIEELRARLQGPTRTDTAADIDEAVEFAKCFLAGGELAMIRALLAIASCPRLPDRVRDDAGLVAAVMILVEIRREQRG